MTRWLRKPSSSLHFTGNQSLLHNWHVPEHTDALERRPPFTQSLNETESTNRQQRKLVSFTHYMFYNMQYIYSTVSLLQRQIDNSNSHWSSNANCIRIIVTKLCLW